MANQIMNVKKVEVCGATKEEALASAPFNVNLPGADCTQALRNAKKKHTGAWTTADDKQFMLEQLEKKTRNTPGNGCYIVLESAIVDSREKPYKIVDVKSTGARKKAKVFQLIATRTQAILAETPVTQVTHTDKEGNVILDKNTGEPKLYWKSATKADAKKLQAKYYMDGGQEETDLKLVDKVVEGEEIVAHGYYTPSKNSRPGRYLCFGIESF